MCVCNTCFRHCHLKEGQKGFCGARICRNGRVVCDSYGYLTSLALDPIEKKPLAMFHPGSLVVSAGSYGCNLACPFCQNFTILQEKDRKGTRYVSPEELLILTEETRARYPETIGVAYTYNEMLTSWEYVRDASRLIHDTGMLNVLVTNGTAEPAVINEILPYIDAMNIDLKGFTDEFYTDFVGGSLAETKNFIRTAARHCHVEVTTLIIPGRNDSEEEIEKAAKWLSSLLSMEPIAYHITRYFPRWKLDTPATDVRTVYHLADVVRQYLPNVFVGNC
ncbi:MAG: radical SAM protein [Eubacterium sp.]|nr:radical SAM protein [Eubacterium sp.]